MLAALKKGLNGAVNEVFLDAGNAVNFLDCCFKIRQLKSQNLN
jgi:hypothetical protein